MTDVAPNPQALRPLILTNERGQDVVNPARDGEASIWLTTANAFPMVVAAGQLLTDFWVAPRGKKSGDVEVNALAAYSNVPFVCRLKEPTEKGGWYYSNAPVHHNLMFGRGGKPFKLLRPIYVDAGSFLEVEVTSRAVALSGNIRPVAQARWLMPQLPAGSREAIEQAADNRRSRPFWLTDDATVTTLTAGQTDKDIFMTMPAGMRLINAYLLVESNGPVSLDIYAYEQGFRFTQGGRIDSRIIGGNAAYPGELGGPIITEPSQRINVKATDLSGLANTVFCTFHGIAVADGGSIDA